MKSGKISGCALVLSPFSRAAQDESPDFLPNSFWLIVLSAGFCSMDPMKFYEIPMYSCHFSYFMMGIQRSYGIPRSAKVPLKACPWARFINLINNEPTIRTLLPLSPTGMEDPEDETFKLTTEKGKLKVAFLYFFFGLGGVISSHDLKAGGGIILGILWQFGHGWKRATFDGKDAGLLSAIMYVGDHMAMKRGERETSCGKTIHIWPIIGNY